MIFKKNEGVAIVLVMALLVIGGILIPVLMRATETHINVAVHKEAVSKSFYAADSGVEFVKANLDQIRKINFNSINSGDFLLVEDDDGELKFSFQDDKYYIDSNVLEMGDIKFNISVSSTGSNPSFISEGNYVSTSGKKYTERIKFDISVDSGLKSFNIQEVEDVEDYYNESGPGNLLDHININDWGAEDFISFASLFLSNSFFENDDFVDDSEEIIDQYYENTDKNFNNEDIDGENIIIKNGNLIIKDTNINNSIVVIDGYLDFDPPSGKISNSIVIVKKNVTSQGTSSGDDFENNMFYIYSNDPNTQGYYLDFRGTGNFDINPGDLPEEYKPKLSISGWEQL